MKRYFMSLLGALQGCSQALSDLVQVGAQLVEGRAAGGDLEARVESIERDLQKWEAQVEAELLRAESKFKQARAAEERTRHAARAIESDEEGEDDQLEAWRSLVQTGNDRGGESDGMQPMRGGVEAPLSAKQRLRQQKFGL